MAPTWCRWTNVTRRALLEGEGRYEQLALSKDGAQVAFLTDRGDVEADQPAFSLYRAGAPGWQAEPLAASGTDGLPDGWWGKRTRRRSLLGGRYPPALRHGPPPGAGSRRTRPWRRTGSPSTSGNWKDAYLQPMQLVQAEDERKRTYAAAVHLDTGSVVQLGTIRRPDGPARGGDRRAARPRRHRQALPAAPLLGRALQRSLRGRPGHRRAPADCRQGRALRPSRHLAGREVRRVVERRRAAVEGGAPG